MRWELIVKRETNLFERYLRVLGYKKMLGSPSKVNVKSLLAISKYAITSQYMDIEETRKRRKLTLSEYKRFGFDKMKNWFYKIEKNLANATKLFLNDSNEDNIRQFYKYYLLSRAVVLYTFDLAEGLKEQKISRHITELGKIYDNMEARSSGLWDKLQPVFKKICLKHGLKLEELTNYLPKEFIKLLKTGKKVNPELIKNRRNFYVLYLKNGRMKLFTGVKAKNIEKREIKKTENQTELRGKIAFRGIIAGRVRIVNSFKQMKNMKKGEILVSSMTTPRLLPAVKKAAAIVTDEGGIICHAAIIAREYKIPCIVGTKNATKILKDGDIIKVDAIKGIIKK